MAEGIKHRNKTHLDFIICHQQMAEEPISSREKGSIRVRQLSGLSLNERTIFVLFLFICDIDFYTRISPISHTLCKPS